jgi:hypothetical protein
MPFRPPKGVRPPQLEGKRTGRPVGSKNYARAWREAQWGYEHADDDVPPPTAGAGVWRLLAQYHPDEVQEFLAAFGVIEAEEDDDW